MALNLTTTISMALPGIPPMEQPDALMRAADMAMALPKYRAHRGHL
jgi:hypothetical protein